MPRHKSVRERPPREQLLSAVRQFYADKLDPDERTENRDFYITEPGDGLSLPVDFIEPSVVLFGVFGIVALLTSTIGVFSAQLSAILERDRELGVRRAPGASKCRLVLALAGEASAVALIAGLLGRSRCGPAYPDDELRSRRHCSLTNQPTLASAGGACGSHAYN